MLLLKFKNTIISSRIGRGADVLFRILLSFIPRLHVFASRGKDFTPDSFVFFSYGGLGDVILTIPLINKVSKFAPTFVLCDKRIYSLRHLFSDSIDFILYDKNLLLSQANTIKNEIKGINPVFVQTSPTIEVYFVGQLLGFRNSIGNILSFRQVHSVGFSASTSFEKSNSRLVNFDHIYSRIKNEFGFQEPNQGVGYIPTGRPKNTFKRLDGNYIVLSPTKSEQWAMGKMLPEEYANVADYVAEKCNCTVVFTGGKSEVEYIDSIIKMTSNPRMMENIAGETTIEDMSAILHHSKFVIANDNGIAHLSAYFNLRVLVLYMFSDPEVYLWDSPNYEYIFNNVEKCMPCVSLDKYPRDNYPVLCKNNLKCNSSITSRQVIERLRRLEWLDVI